MSRPKRYRKINHPPKIKGMNPFGYYGSPNSAVKLFHEEFEAIRLLDYEGLNQNEAAEAMEVSRPTITRIYNSARKKVATAMAEGRQLLIEGGQAIFKDNWYECSDCSARFNLDLAYTKMECPICTNKKLKSLSI